MIDWPALQASMQQKLGAQTDSVIKILLMKFKFRDFEHQKILRDCPLIAESAIVEKGN